MNGNRQVLIGLLAVIVALVAALTFQILGKPEQSAGASIAPDTVDRIAADVVERVKSMLNEAGASAGEASAFDDRLATALGALEDRLRGHIDAVLEPAGAKREAPSTMQTRDRVPEIATGDFAGAESAIPDGTEAAENTQAIAQINRVTEEAPPAAIEPLPESEKLQEIHFLHDSWNLTPGGLRKAREAAEWFHSNEPGKLKVVGFSDRRGSSDYNLQLSERRAGRVTQWLVDAGVPRDRIEVLGLGETGLPEPTQDGVAEPLNRCVGIIAVR